MACHFESLLLFQMHCYPHGTLVDLLLSNNVIAAELLNDELGYLLAGQLLEDRVRRLVLIPLVPESTSPHLFEIWLEFEYRTKMSIAGKIRILPQM